MVDQYCLVIEESDYDEYLTKWGNLIIETNDNLMDYLIVYVIKLSSFIAFSEIFLLKIFIMLSNVFCDKSILSSHFGRQKK